MKVSNLFENFEELPFDNPSDEEQLYYLQKQRYRRSNQLRTAFNSFKALMSKYPEYIQKPRNGAASSDPDEDPLDRQFFPSIMIRNLVRSPDSSNYNKPQTLSYPAFIITRKNRKFFRDAENAYNQMMELNKQNDDLYREELMFRNKLREKL